MKETFCSRRLSKLRFVSCNELKALCVGQLPAMVRTPTLDIKAYRVDSYDIVVLILTVDSSLEVLTRNQEFCIRISSAVEDVRRLHQRWIIVGGIFELLDIRLEFLNLTILQKRSKIRWFHGRSSIGSQWGENKRSITWVILSNGEYWKRKKVIH